MVEIEAMKSNLKRNKYVTYDQKGNFFGTPIGEITGRQISGVIITKFLGQIQIIKYSSYNLWNLDIHFPFQKMVYDDKKI